MGLIRIRETGAVMTEISFRSMHKKAKTRPVLEPVLTKERLSQLGADAVLNGAQPDFTPPYEFSFEDGVEQDELGNWVTVNRVVRNGRNRITFRRNRRLGDFNSR